MTAEVYGGPRESSLVVRENDIVGFALVTLAMILFVAWPRRSSYDGPRVRRDKKPEGPAHPYRRAATQPPKDRTWIWRMPPR